MVLRKKLQAAHGEAQADAQARSAQRHLEVPQYVRTMRERLDEYRGRCAWCVYHGHHDAGEHAYEQCSRDAELHLEYFKQKRLMRYNKQFHKVCWRCGVPSLHDDLHRAFEVGAASCEWPDVVHVVIWAVANDRKMASAACTAFQTQEICPDRCFAWFSRCPVVNYPGTKEVRASNAFSLFEWYSEEKSAKKGEKRKRRHRNRD